MLVAPELHPSLASFTEPEEALEKLGLYFFPASDEDIYFRQLHEINLKYYSSVKEYFVTFEKVRRWANICRSAAQKPELDFLSVFRAFLTGFDRDIASLCFDWSFINQLSL